MSREKKASSINSKYFYVISNTKKRVKSENIVHCIIVLTWKQVVNRQNIVLHVLTYSIWKFMRNFQITFDGCDIRYYCKIYINFQMYKIIIDKINYYINHALITKMLPCYVWRIINCN